MQQFFIEDLKDLSLNPDQIRQCRQVLRMEKGDCIRIVDQKGKGLIARFTSEDLKELEVVEELIFEEKKHQTTLVMAQIRNKALEWLLQKASELGVDEILLYPADHGVVKGYGQKNKRKAERFREIVKEASEQSYRSTIPTVKILDDLSEIFTMPNQLRLVADVKKHPFILEEISKEDRNVQIIVGPEGGFSEDERELFRENDCRFVTLSSQILRAETAGMIAVHLAEMRHRNVGN